MSAASDAGADGGQPPVVLAVDDEERVTQAFGIWLDEYEVRRATDGEEALEKLDADVDVVLLDRQMPGLSGDEVLDRIRDRDLDCRVAMVTGVDPDLAIVDMPFDDYVQKPVDAEELRATVEELLSLSRYGSDVRTLFALASKQAALEAAKPESELADSDRYRRLVENRRAVEAELSERLADLDPEEYERLFEAIE